MARASSLLLWTLLVGLLICALALSVAASVTNQHQPASSDKECSGHGEKKGDKCDCFRNTENGFWDKEDCSECLSPYVGEKCLERECLNNCNGHGTCDTTTGTCTCHKSSDTGYWDKEDCSACLPPYVGDKCLELECPQNCSKHGTCNSTTGTCTCHKSSDTGYWDKEDCSVCLPPYVGDKCLELECPNNCNGHGTCDTTTGTCTCHKGSDTGYWDKENCSVCLPPYVGDKCLELECPNNCSGHGACNTTTGVCVCSFGWSGDACQHEIEVQNELASIQPISWLLTLVAVVVTAATVSTISLNIYGTGLLSLRGYVMGLIDTIQFGGVTSVVGTALPPLYLKFAVLLSWSNFFFNIWGVSNRVLELHKELVFIMNLVMVGALVILTVLICLSIIAVRVKFLNLHHHQIRERFFNLCIPSLLRIGLLVYMGMSVSVSFQLCQVFNGLSPLYHPLNILAALTFLIFNVGFIFVVVLLLTRKDVVLKDARFKRKFGCLYNEFRQEFYVFEAVVLFKKLVLGTMLGFFQDNAGIQLMVISVLLLVYLVMLLTLQPYASRRKNYLEMVLVVVQAATILLVYMGLGIEGAFLSLLTLCVLGLICSIALAFVATLVYDFFVKPRLNKFMRPAPRSLQSPTDEDELQEQQNQPQVHILIDEDDPDSLIFDEDEVDNIPEDPHNDPGDE